MVVNSRLRENPALQKMPRDEREWVHFANEMAKWVIQIAKLGDGSITTSSGTTIDGLGELPGTLISSDSLNTITAFNVGSLQNISPITATDAGSDATINIASHNLIYDSITLAYNSGSVTGLSFSTEYFIYVVDASKAGGAVTYIASTTRTDLTAGKDRYFVGRVTTPADGAGNNNGNGGGGGGDLYA